MSDKPLIALISATPAAIGPATAGLAANFPDATVWNILDDRLLKDAQEQSGITPGLEERMRRLIEHALAEGADGVLLTCSMYGSVAHAFPTPAVPILAPDDASFAAVVAGRYSRILVVASFETALVDAQQRLEQVLAEQGAGTEVLAAVAEGALNATTANDGDALLRSLLDACEGYRGKVDAVLLAQYSLAPAASALGENLGMPVLSGPDAAAALLRTRITDAA